MLLSNDETELINRMRKKGYVALYEPAAVVKHHIFPERLTKAWMRRRAAWQAVSDFLSNPELSYKDGRATKRKFDGMLAVERQPTFWKRLTGKADEPARGRWFKSDTMATHTYRTVLAALAGYTLDEVADFDEEADEK